ncbi:hypothetical protein HOF92_08570 [bacterium]|nr:hypothetical protein [bacterium]
MTALNEDQEMKEFVLRTLLFEVLKDGKIDAEEKDAVQALGPVLQLSRQRAGEIRDEVLKSVQGAQTAGSVSYVQLFQTVRKKLLEQYQPDVTDNYLEMLAKTLKCQKAFFESLSLGF